MPTPERTDIRPLEPADVPALLKIIAAARAEYGIAGHPVPESYAAHLVYPFKRKRKKRN